MKASVSLSPDWAVAARLFSRYACRTCQTPAEERKGRGKRREEGGEREEERGRRREGEAGRGFVSDEHNQHVCVFQQIMIV